MPTLFPALLPVALLVMQGQPMAPENFFRGRTEGAGTASIILSGTSNIRTLGQGRVLADGTLQLDHVVYQEGAAERRRTFRFRRLANGQYSGTISDARGPVVARQYGNRFNVTYRTAEGNVDQWITFNPNGTATNQMTITRLGFRVATVQETIRRTGN